MSYPFGFDGTFHGFHFRSVFIPVVLSCLAVFLAGFPEGRTGSARWALVLLALCVSSMPIFFQFEYADALPSPVYWGLVDNFIATVSGIAAAATVQSLRRTSLAWLSLALLASAFSFLIKPARLLTMVARGRRRFMVRLPLDWQRPPSFGLSDMVESDYLIFSPLRDPAARERAVSRNEIVTFAQESALVHALFTNLGESAGVRVEWDGRFARLLRVENAETLRMALTSLLAHYTMRAEFLAANPEFAKAGP